MSKPSALNARAASRVAQDVYGIDATASPLPGEKDLNFRLHAKNGSIYVLKLHHPDADTAELDLLTAALLHVGAAAGAPRVPRMIRTSEGEMASRVEVAGGDRVVRLLSWIDGRPWAHCAPHGPKRLADLGRSVARLDRALVDFRHPAERRPLLWNLTSAPAVAAFVELVEPGKQDSVREIFSRYETVVAPRLGCLPHQVIHNDANELNILIGEDGTVSGLIDFGDVAWSPRVGGLAVAAAYAMLSQDDPVRAIVPVVSGYDGEWPLRPEELEVLYDLIRLRLAMSVAMAAWQYANDPGNDYLLVSQRSVWRTLGLLTSESPDLAHFRFRDACGWDAVPAARHVRQFFESGRAQPSSVLPIDVSSAHATILDLSNKGFDSLEPTALVMTATEIEDRIDREGTALALGLYGEERAVYRVPQYDLGGGRRCSVHLGVDLFLAAGTQVRAPLDGVVRIVADHPLPLDFGGLVVLEHRTNVDVPFWTLYGHLDPESIDGLAPGDVVARGREVGCIGGVERSGGWPPHLHLHLLTYLGELGADVPGVAPPDEDELWQSISPDPNLLLRRRGGDATRISRSAEAIVRRRRGSLSQTLSSAYREPLQIVRGEGAHLYDAAGSRWLDLVNNVCHVGHCHPRVLAAGQRQMAVLNTNTRYLHDSVVTYARRLAATLPDPLRVVFVVNSGSEANDLALRLATTHTGQEDVLVLDHAYHGHLSSTVALSPYKFDGPGGRGKPDTTHVCELPDPYRGRWRTEGPDLGRLYAESVRGHVEALAAAGRRPAAFFAEPLQSVGGQIVYPRGYLAAAFEHVRAAGAVCVVDEVQVGFGRVGEYFWGFELQDVVPDVVTLGKPIGNGHPLAAVVTTPEIAASFVTGMEYFNTFGGNPVSCEIGLAVLDVIRDEGLQANASAVGDRMLVGLRELGHQHGLIGDVRGHGLFIGVELSLDPASRAPATNEAGAVKEAVKARGVLISTDGRDNNVLKIKPPLVLNAEDCDFFLEALDQALAEVEASL